MQQRLQHLFLDQSKPLIRRHRPAPLDHRRCVHHRPHAPVQETLWLEAMGNPLCCLLDMASQGRFWSLHPLLVVDSVLEEGLRRLAPCDPREEQQVLLMLSNTI